MCDAIAQRDCRRQRGLAEVLGMIRFPILLSHRNALRNGL